MNPFAKYPGIRLNGKFYDRSTLLNKAYHNEKSENLIKALDFAGTLFDSSSEISVQTSGSTGLPKNILFPKKAVITSAEATNNFFGLNQNSVAVLPLPMQYIAGRMMVARAITGKYNLIVLKPDANPDLAGIRADFIPVTPLQLINLIEGKPSEIKNVKTFLVGGGAPSASLIEKSNKADLNVFSSFGMTETLSHFALADLRLATEFPVYTPVKGASVRIDNLGKLEVNWPGITKGWLNTNDLAHIEDGKFYWKGRADNLINSGGIKIIPERAEEILESYISSPFFVAGIPHDTLGEEVVLITEDQVNIDLNSVTWDFKHQQPKRILRINPFLRTVSGKIQRIATIQSM